MRFYEFSTTTPSPQQARINSLKLQKERVSAQLKTEREQQKKQKATQQLQQSNQVLAKIRSY